MSAVSTAYEINGLVANEHYMLAAKHHSHVSITAHEMLHVDQLMNSI